MIATHFRLLFRSSSTTVYPLIRYEVKLNFLLLRRKRCVDSLDIAARQMWSYEAVGGLYQHGRYEAAAMVEGWVSKEVSRMQMIFLDLSPAISHTFSFRRSTARQMQ